MTDLISINGVISNEDDAKIPAYDRGFIFGDALSETILGYKGVLIDFSAHMERLRNAAELCFISVPWTDEQIRFEIEHLFSIQKFTSYAVRLLISRGLGHSPASTGLESAQRYIYCKPIEFDLRLQKKPSVKIKTVINPFHSSDILVKSNNYLNPISTQLKARKVGFDDILWVNANQEITECSFSNIFLIGREGDQVEIATPTNSGILPGITRSRVINLLESSKIPVTIRPIVIDEIPKFDEAFMTSSINCLVGINAINNHRLHTDRERSTFNQIRNLYSSWLESQANESKEANYTDKLHQ